MLIGVEPARATNIQIDLGPPPVVSDDVTVPFADLNGTSLSGQNLSLNFTFSGAEFVRLFSATTADFEVLVKLQTNSPGLAGFLDGTGFLIDQLGNPLQPPQALGSASSDDGLMAAGLFPLFAGAGAPNRPFDFFEVHLDLTLPSNSSFLVTGGEFELLGSRGGPFGVGPGVPNDITTPDTGSSFLLLCLGSLGPMLVRTRLTRAS
jgi:hypothetical protein